MNVVEKSRIPYLLHAGPVLALAMLVLGLGGLAGMIAANGAVLVARGYYEVVHPVLAALVMFGLAALLLAFTGFIKPMHWKLEFSLYNREWALLVAVAYILGGLGLLFFNLSRLSVFELMRAGAPGEIAFRLVDEHGAVIYYTTMLCFFIGASFILDTSENWLVRSGVYCLIGVFSLGLLVTTRREMLLLIFVWGIVHLLTRRRVRIAVLFAVALGTLAALAVALQFRDVDIINDPTSYFLSGEFEPFRFALYLIDYWLREGGVLYPPWSYAIPFVHYPTVADSTNCKFVLDFLGDSTCLGSYTITIFVTLLYFNFLVPLLFFALAVWLAKQTGYWLERKRSTYTSFLYAFCLLKLFLFVRNGELFNSVIDDIVLVVLAGAFHLATGWRISSHYQESI